MYLGSRRFWLRVLGFGVPADFGLGSVPGLRNLSGSTSRICRGSLVPMLTSRILEKTEGNCRCNTTRIAGHKSQKLFQGCWTTKYMYEFRNFGATFACFLVPRFRLGELAISKFAFARSGIGYLLAG